MRIGESITVLGTIGELLTRKEGQARIKLTEHDDLEILILGSDPVLDHALSLAFEEKIFVCTVASKEEDQTILKCNTLISNRPQTTH